MPSVPRAPLITAVSLGAFLLFLVQPMAARFILPWFGGGPTVWSTCLLFFQIALLAGYTYTHVIRRLTLTQQTRLHVTLLAIAMLAVFCRVESGWRDALHVSNRYLELAPVRPARGCWSRATRRSSRGCARRRGETGRAVGDLDGCVPQCDRRAEVTNGPCQDMG